MDLEDFRRFLSGGHRVTPPGSGRAAIRAWLSLRHVGQPLSLHQEHILVGGQRIALAPWAMAFLEVSDRLPPGQVEPLEILDALVEAAWDPDRTTRTLLSAVRLTP